jgi:hypothetical protein
MATIQPVDLLRIFPRAPRAQFFAKRVRAKTHTMISREEIIEQPNRSSASPEQPYSYILDKN